MAEQEKSVLWTGTLQATAEQGVRTGLTLNTRDSNITITVDGSAKFWPGDGPWGPDGKPNDANQDKMLDPQANAGAVLMKVGTGPYRVVGKGMSDWTIREDGELTFYFNDQPGDYGDNSGSFNIAVLRQLKWGGTLQATNEQGIKTGITVNTRTDKISVTVKGEGTPWPGHGPYGPEGYPGASNQGQLLDPKADAGSVLLKIGNGPYTVVGNGLSNWPVPVDGEIAFFYNDVPGLYGDNSGSFEITLSVN
ncbi:LecA/PA-IL family lectin [Mesorhizobium sp. RMAD-H1]|uniref:LecA/PA-IL family lectin n=1 Tax=Mesorhizobium sp. RMAD-H1 TaxID=2587065 RepID=UPI00161FED2A|nr:LecA/PA-IL family lectin [Mesorhizobium sp. RMAD-H1]MBB2972847.1 hypothetical protein [Mesorhizobium sp. RMAD-H1]